MAYTIKENCKACGKCQDACPVDAIHEGEIYTIDKGACISCGACTTLCPINAIVEI